MSDEINPTNPAPSGPSVPSPSAKATGDKSAPSRPSACGKCEEYLAGWKRANADYANLKKQMETVYAAAAKEGQADLVMSLLPVWDGFLKALAHPPRIEEGQQLNSTEVRNWVRGIVQVRQQLESVFNRTGVTIIDRSDIPFDPNVHEAMLTEKRNGVEPGRVLAVIEPGYRLGDRVLRAAKVVVAG